MNKFIELSKIASITVGFVGNMKQHYCKTGIPFFRSLNIKPFYIEENDLKHISEEFSKSISKSILKENDIVIVRTGIPGTSCVIPKKYSGSNCSDLVIVHPDLEKVNPHYLEAYINFFGKKQVDNNKVGAVQKHFNVQEAGKMLIYLPPLDKQNVIADFLCNINEKIHINNEICQNLKKLAENLYDYWFAQFDFPDENGRPYKSSGGKMIWKEELKREIPEGWKVKHVSDLTNVVTGREDANFSSSNGQYKFFTCSQNILQCDKPAFFGHAVMIAGNGDFNVKHYTGKFNAYQRTYVLIPDNEKFYGIMYIAAKKQIQKFKNGSNGSIIKFITKGDVENIPIILPSNDDVLFKLNFFIEKIEMCERENEELIKLRDFLLPMLMNGQVTIKDQD